jgi:hypothetical protein
METRGERREKKQQSKKKMKVHNAARWTVIQQLQQKRAKKNQG